MRGLDRIAMPLSRLAAAAAIAALGACTTVGQPAAPPAAAVETIQILGLSDFHGNVEPPAPVTYFVAGEERREQLGGAARLGAALAQLRHGQPNTITVAAGDLIGASPLVSAYFLDEPTVMALNRLGLSARGCLALVRVSKTWAAADGRDHVLPDDVKELAEPVLCHRLLLDAEAQFSGVTIETVIARLLDNVAPPTDRVA